MTLLQAKAAPADVITSVTFFLLALFLLSGCSSDAETPERQVTRLLEEAEVAAEKKDVSRLGKMVSEEYSDRHGNDRQAIVGMVRYHFLRNETVHIMTKIGKFSLAAPGRLGVTVFAALAGTPIATAGDLDPLRASLYRFDLVFSLDVKNTWKLAGADWRRATVADFFLLSVRKHVCRRSPAAGRQCAGSSQSLTIFFPLRTPAFPMALRVSITSCEAAAIFT